MNTETLHKRHSISDIDRFVADKSRTESFSCFIIPVFNRLAAVNDLSHKKTTHADFQGLINSWSKVDWDVDNRGECLGAVLLGKTIHTIIYHEIICREQTSYYISEVDIFAVRWLWMRVSCKIQKFPGGTCPRTHLSSYFWASCSSPWVFN